MELVKFETFRQAVLRQIPDDMIATLGVTAEARDAQIQCLYDTMMELREESERIMPGYTKKYLTPEGFKNYVDTNGWDEWYSWELMRNSPASRDEVIDYLVRFTTKVYVSDLFDEGLLREAFETMLDDAA